MGDFFNVEAHSGKSIEGLTGFDKFVQYRRFSRRIQTQEYNSSNFSFTVTIYTRQISTHDYK